MYKKVATNYMKRFPIPELQSLLWSTNRNLVVSQIHETQQAILSNNTSRKDTGQQHNMHGNSK